MRTGCHSVQLGPPQGDDAIPRSSELEEEGVEVEVEVEVKERAQSSLPAAPLLLLPTSEEEEELAGILRSLFFATIEILELVKIRGG